MAERNAFKTEKLNDVDQGYGMSMCVAGVFLNQCSF
jgi:hypothetical protein